MNDLVTV